MIRSALLFFLTLLTITCQKPIENTTTDSNEKTENQDLVSIQRPDSTSFSSVLRIRDSLLKLSNNASTDSLKAHYRLLAADAESAVPGKALFAIRRYHRIAADMPQSQVGAYALFLAAVTFERQLNDRERARKQLGELITNYPKTRIAREAHVYDSILQFDDPALIKSFENIQNSNQSK